MQLVRDGRQAGRLTGEHDDVMLIEKSAVLWSLLTNGQRLNTSMATLYDLPTLVDWPGRLPLVDKLDRVSRS